MTKNLVGWMVLAASAGSLNSSEPCLTALDLSRKWHS